MKWRTVFLKAMDRNCWKSVAIRVVVVVVLLCTVVVPLVFFAISFQFNDGIVWQKDTSKILQPNAGIARSTKTGGECQAFCSRFCAIRWITSTGDFPWRSTVRESFGRKFEAQTQ